MRPTLLALAVAAALAPGALLAQNALNPAPVNPSTAGRWMDEEGLGTRIPAARSPTGLLYNVPLDPGPEEDAPPKDAWRWTGFLEGGWIGVTGDEHAQGFRYYKDLRDGPYLNLFAVRGEHLGAAQYFEATGGGVGRSDQFYRAQAGRYNDWRLTATYDETPQTFTSTYRSLWNGIGTGNLTLISLTPGGTTNGNTTQANIRGALAGADATELEAVRKKAGVRIDKVLSDTWKTYASFTSERKEGARPMGMVFGGGGGGGNLEMAEPIDYQTQEIMAGLQYNDAVSSFNARAWASLFRNQVDTLTVQNPLYITTNGSGGLAPGAFTQGRFDLPPDNEHYNARAEYARAIPDLWRGHFTATAALGSMRQDDALIAPTTLPLTGGTVTAGGAPLANNWNTTSALSQSSANARLDTRLVDLSLAMKPAKALDLKAKVRYYETDNASQYLACNPLTGQFGRILNDGSGVSLVGASTTAGANPAGTSANAYNTARCDLAAARALNLVPATGNVPILSVPADYRQVNASLTGDYQLRRTTSVNGVLERESFHREYRERDETREDRLKLGLVERGLLEGLIRVTWEHARRSGSDYHENPYEQFLSASLGPDPAANGVAVQSWFHSIAQFRSFDLADRKQDVVNARVNHAFLPTLDGALTLQVRDADFPAAYGRSGRQKAQSATFDFTWQSGAAGEVYGFYAWQNATGNQKGIAPGSCTLGTAGVTAANWRDFCGTASATSPLFPDARGWDVDSKDRNDAIGAGLRYDLGRAKLDASFMRTLGRTRIGYSYDAAALGLTPTQAALAGDGLSDITFAQNVVSVSVLVPIDKTFSVRALVRFESGKYRDWHYEGLAENPMPTNNTLYLDGGPTDYRTTAVGLMLQVRL